MSAEEDTGLTGVAPLGVNPSSHHGGNLRRRNVNGIRTQSSKEHHQELRVHEGMW